MLERGRTACTFYTWVFCLPVCLFVARCRTSAKLHANKRIHILSKKVRRWHPTEDWLHVPVHQACKSHRVVPGKHFYGYASAGDVQKLLQFGCSIVLGFLSKCDLMIFDAHDPMQILRTLAVCRRSITAPCWSTLLSSLMWIHAAARAVA